MSTDYLLKDECETPQPIEGVEPSDKDFPLKKVSVEDANDFMEVRKKNAPKIAAAVAACIVSPSVLIFWQDYRRRRLEIFRGCGCIGWTGMPAWICGCSGIYIYFLRYARSKDSSSGKRMF